MQHITFVVAMVMCAATIILNDSLSEEHTARLAAEAKVQTVSEYVKTQMKDKQTRAILCAK